MLSVRRYEALWDNSVWGPLCLEALSFLGLHQVVGAEECPLLLALCFQACVLRNMSAWGDITKVHVALYLGLLSLWHPGWELVSAEMFVVELELAASSMRGCLCLCGTGAMV